VSRGRTREQRGFTLVEVAFAAFCLALFLGGLSTLFLNGNNSSLASQRQAAMVAVADKQIEAIRQAVKANGFAALAMSGAPAVGAGTRLPYNNNVHIDPNDFAQAKTGCGPSNSELTIYANYNDVSEGTSTGNEPAFAGCDAGSEPLVIQLGTGIVTPSSAVTVGTETATLDSYVTQTNVGCNASLGNGNCQADARRLVIAIVPNNNGVYNQGPNSPLFISTIFTNPVPSNAPNSSIGITLGLNIG
jgi:type II secretory pathway pseudopilin PulG